MNITVFTIQYRFPQENHHRYIKKVFHNAFEALTEAYRLSYMHISQPDQDEFDTELSNAFNNNEFDNDVYYNCDELEFHLDKVKLNRKQTKEYKWLTDKNITSGLYLYRHDDVNYICGFRNAHFFMVKKETWHEYALKYQDFANQYNDYVQVENMFNALGKNHYALNAVASQFITKQDVDTLLSTNATIISANRYEAFINNSIVRKIYWNWKVDDSINIPMSLLRIASDFTNFDKMRISLCKFKERHILCAQCDERRFYVFTYPLNESFMIFE